MLKKREIILPAVLLAMLLVVGGLAAKLYIDGQTDARALEAIQAELDAERESRAEWEAALSVARSERDTMATELAELEEKFSGARDDALLLEDEQEALAEQIALLRAMLAEKEEKIASLENEIAQFNRVYPVDVQAQAARIEELLTALEEEAPLRKIEKVDEDGNLVDPPEDREVVKEDDEAYYIYPRLAVYYEDLSNGYRFTYGENETFFSASLIKAPYVLWLLETVSREEDAAIARAQAAEDAVEKSAGTAAETVSDARAAHDAVPETTVGETTSLASTDAEEEPARPAMLFTDERYDLSRIFIYTKEKKREGSGIIQYAPEGTEYTYRELVELAIRKSDNVAFAELRNVFGYSDFYAFNTRLGVNSVRKNFNQITAADMAIYLRAMYKFIEEDENYGAEFKSWLCQSAHSVLIPYAVYPTTTAHKYGWDEESYHDAAIVYDEHPYLLVVLTDLDEGGDEVDTYIRDLVKKVNSLHKQFYS